jgi:hypothetical protein
MVLLGMNLVVGLVGFPVGQSNPTFGSSAIVIPMPPIGILAIILNSELNNPMT